MINLFKQLLVRWGLAVGVPIFVAKYTFLCVFNINGVTPSVSFIWISTLVVDVWLFGFLVGMVALIISWLGRQISIMLD